MVDLTHSGSFIRTNMLSIVHGECDDHGPPRDRVASHSMRCQIEEDLRIDMFPSPTRYCCGVIGLQITRLHYSRPDFTAVLMVPFRKALRATVETF